MLRRSTARVAPRSPVLCPVPRAYDWSALPAKGEAVLQVIARAHRREEGSAQRPTATTDIPSFVKEVVARSVAVAPDADSVGSVDAWSAFLANAEATVTSHFEPLPCAASLARSCGGTAPSTVCAAALLGDMMAVGVSQPGFIWLASPIATELEALLGHWIAQAVGLPTSDWSWTASATGGKGGMAMQNSTTEALMVAMLGARTRAGRDTNANTEPRRFTAYCSAAAPTRVDKAARLLGFEPVRRLERFDLTALNEAMARDVALGLTPTFVSLCVGTRSDGLHDDVAVFTATSGDGAVGARPWLHVDAGYAFFAATCPELRPAFNGWKRADSISANTGSWLPVGVNSALLYFRDRASIASSLNASGSYLDNPHSATGTVVDFKDFHMGLGRTFRALKCYTAWRALGLAGVQALVRRHRDAAAWIEAQLQKTLCSAVRVVPSRVPGVITLTGTGIDAVAKRLRDLHLGSPIVVEGQWASSSLRIPLSSNHWTDQDLAELVTAITGAPCDVVTAVPFTTLHALPRGAKNAASDEEFAGAARSLLADIAALHVDLGKAEPSVPLLSAFKPGFVKDLLPMECPVEPCASLSDVVADFRRLVVPAVTHWHHRRFYAFFPAMVSPSGLLGDLLGLATHQTLATAKTNPAATELEHALCSQLAALYGLPVSVFGGDGDGGCILQPSATEAMIVMMRAALQRYAERVQHGTAALTPFSEYVAYYTEDSHFCAEKAARILGVTHRKIPSQPIFQATSEKQWSNTEVDVAALRDAMRRDRDEGRHPFFVSVSVGATGTCAIDNLAAVRDVCASDAVWMNVDAAYAGTAALCPELRHLFAGWEEADSILINATKWGSASFNANVTFCRHRQHVSAVFGRTGAETNASDMMSLHLGDSQSARALKMLAVLADFGVAGLQASVRRHNAVAAYLADRLLETVGPEQLHVLPPQFGLVCFAVEAGDAQSTAAQRTQRVLDAIHRSLGAFVVTAMIKGKTFVRISFAHPAADYADADALVHVIANALARPPAASKL